MDKNSWIEEAVAKSEERGLRYLQDRVHEAIMAIDRELSIIKHAEFRQILVNTGYALRDLSLSIQCQESFNASASRTSSPVH